MGPTSVTQTSKARWRPQGGPSALWPSWPRTPHRPIKCVPGLSCLQAPHCAVHLCRHRSLSKGSTCCLLDAAVGLASSPRTAGKHRCVCLGSLGAPTLVRRGAGPWEECVRSGQSCWPPPPPPAILRMRETAAQWWRLRQLRLTRERPVEVRARRQCPLLERAWLDCCLRGPQPLDGRVSPGRVPDNEDPLISPHSGGPWIYHKWCCSLHLSIPAPLQSSSPEWTWHSVRCLPSWGSDATVGHRLMTTAVSDSSAAPPTEHTEVQTHPSLGPKTCVL